LCSAYKDSILAGARWPTPGEVDSTVIQQSDYLMESVREFRYLLNLSHLEAFVEHEVSKILPVTNFPN
jgi:hypothetical protein